MKVGKTEFVISEDTHGPFVITKFEDGAFVIARPMNEPWEKTVQHDWTHTFLAWCLFQEPSYVLWKIAHPEENGPKNIEWWYAEEEAVLHIIEFLEQRRMETHEQGDET